jgi:hypothetical protein
VSGPSTVELRGDPGNGDQRDGGDDDIELHVAQPREILQIGIAQEVNRHQRYDDLVHGRLLHIAYQLNRRGHGFCNAHLSEVESASQLVGDTKRKICPYVDPCESERTTLRSRAAGRSAPGEQ